MAFLMSLPSRYKLTKKDKGYIDVSLAFIPSPVSGDITILTNERAINNSLKNIIMTLPSEVAFFRDFGSTTNLYLFDMIDESSAVLLEQEIERALLFNEPRITFEPLTAEEDITGAYLTSQRRDTSNGTYITGDLGVEVVARPEQNEYSVNVRYRIVGSEKVFNVSTILTPTR